MQLLSFFTYLTALLRFEIENSREWLQVRFQVVVLSSFLKPLFRDAPHGFAVDFSIFTTLHGFGEVTLQITKENQWFEGYFLGGWWRLWEAWESFLVQNSWQNVQIPSELHAVVLSNPNACTSF